MRSKITIEIDFENNNQPILQIIRRDSSDVRDQLVSKFLQDLAHTSRWCTIQFDRERYPEGMSNEREQVWKIVPVKPEQIKTEIALMEATLINMEQSSLNAINVL